MVAAPVTNHGVLVLGSPAAHAQADETLGRFMDYCTYGHMIDNVVLIVTGTLHERDVQVRQGPPPESPACKCLRVSARTDAPSLALPCSPYIVRSSLGGTH